MSKDLANIIINIVESGDKDNIYIDSEGEIILGKECDKDNIVHKVKCPSLKDLGYRSIDDFIEEDFEYYFGEDIDMYEKILKV